MGDHRKQSGCPPGYRKPMRRVNETHLQEPISSTGSNWLSGEEKSRLEAVQRDWRSSRPKFFYKAIVEVKYGMRFLSCSVFQNLFGNRRRKCVWRISYKQWGNRYRLQSEKQAHAASSTPPADDKQLLNQETIFDRQRALFAWLRKLHVERKEYQGRKYCPALNEWVTKELVVHELGGTA
ncbi:unnamed protein product [Enterobius vermicularis]|uniref:Transposase n=1 Tax=Enterobius vermicularis TaxID=51028 RepID=A0A0N4V5S5_ENTVE|nr:unnamed protein product [Enterobius vermicularis]